MSANLSHDWTVQIDQPPPDGDWSPWLARMNLRGSAYVPGWISDYVKAARSEPCSAAVERETSNPYDENALAVFGVVGAARWRIGYIPKATAAKIAKFSVETPIAVRVLHVRFVGSRIFANVQIYLPPKSTRQMNGWER